MIEDGGGRIWIGTREEGLYRYEGGRMQRLGVTRHVVQALCLGGGGALWIGTPHGLLRLLDGRVERFTRQDGLSHDNVSAVLEDRQGTLWQQAVEAAREHRPDVALIDLRMPGMSGVEAIAAIRRQDPEARIIVLTIHKGDEAVYRAIRAGARGYLLKDVPFQELLAAIRAVHEGRHCLPPEVAAKMAERIRHDELSAREIDVLKLIAGGLSNKRIADRLEITESTVKHHVAGLVAKLGAEDRTHAVTLALERDVIDLEDLELRSGEGTRGR